MFVHTSLMSTVYCCQKSAKILLFGVSLKQTRDFFLTILEVVFIMSNSIKSYFLQVTTSKFSNVKESSAEVSHHRHATGGVGASTGNRNSDDDDDAAEEEEDDDEAKFGGVKQKPSTGSIFQLPPR